MSTRSLHRINARVTPVAASHRSSIGASGQRWRRHHARGMSPAVLDRRLSRTWPTTTRRASRRPRRPSRAALDPPTGRRSRPRDALSHRRLQSLRGRPGHRSRDRVELAAEAGWTTAAPSGQWSLGARLWEACPMPRNPSRQAGAAATTVAWPPGDMSSAEGRLHGLAYQRSRLGVVVSCWTSRPGEPDARSGRRLRDDAGAASSSLGQGTPL